ncbi:MAG: leucyl aminopeptidase [Pseudomonadales bacterium]
MEFSAKVFDDLSNIKTDCLILPVFSDDSSAQLANDFGSGASKTIAALKQCGDFNASIATTVIGHFSQDLAAVRILLVGCGKKKLWDSDAARKLCSATARALLKLNAKQAIIALPTAPSSFDAAWLAKELTQEAVSASYVYSAKRDKKNNKPKLARIQLAAANSKEVRTVNRAIKRGVATGTGINVAKELGNLPGNICTPTYLAAEAKKLARSNTQLKVNILQEKQMKELGMGSLLSVSAGSKQAAKLIVLEYSGGKKSDAPVVLVGKGVTFDSGGISLKPGGKMDEMKYDMCGAASVLGALATLVSMEAKVNVVGIIGATENMPSSIATKPGDVVTSMSGKTIEVLNTDAEGRLVLCDALTYAARFKPRTVIDIATLTGACIVALGSHHSGLFSNNQTLADELLAAGRQSGDTAWQLPIDKAYHEQLKSPFADLANIGGPGAGSITAACFLSQFAEDYCWAHLDIAGTAWNSGGNKGATGRPVAMLVEYLLK